MKSRIYITSFSFFILAYSFSAVAQDDRSQLPPVLRNSYVEVNIGYINYPFNGKHIEDGYTFRSVLVPHTAVRVVLLGYEFNKYLSAKISYLRPVYWVQYSYSKGNTGTEATRSIWMNIGGLTLKPQLPVSDHFSIYGEGGLSIITRHGFEDVDGTPIVKDAKYSTFLLGGGLKYHINNYWGLMLSVIYSPENNKVKQPYTSYLSAGFVYKLRPASEMKLEKATESGYIYPKQMVQIGFTSNILGYGVNDFVSKGKIPIFWGGEAEVHHGVSIIYQRNIFHGARVFSLDLGASASFWQSNVNKDNFFTLSVFPVFRLTILRTKPADIYFYYSVPGPAYISKIIIDGHDTGEHFTFQDTMGTGVFFGAKRNWNTELKIGHYSNGNIFPENEAVKVPLSLNFGYTF
jgi:hypothetical protein